MPSFLDDSYKSARATYRVVLGLCLALLAVSSTNQPPFDEALAELRQVEELGYLDWEDFEYDEGWSTVQAAIAEPSWAAELASVREALVAGVELAQIKLDPSSIELEDLALFHSYTAKGSTTLEEYRFDLSWPSVTVVYPDPDQAPALLAAYFHGAAPSLDRSLDGSQAARTPEAGAIEGSFGAGAPPGAADWAWGGIPDHASASLEVDFVEFSTLYFERTGSFPEGDEGAFPIEGAIRLSLVLEPLEGTADYPVALEVDLPFLESMHIPFGGQREWLAEQGVADLLGPSGDWLPETSTFWLDVRDLTPREAELVLAGKKAESTGKVSYFGVELKGLEASLLGVALLVGAMLFLAASTRNALHHCQREGVDPGSLPWVLASPGPGGKLAFWATLVVLPLLALVGQASQAEVQRGGLWLVPAVGGMLVLGIGLYIGSMLQGARGPGAGSQA
ncbi:MAG: hypothetical protein P1V81_05915 [Planctomycetota bacterium]|nr:hypothetical protein [Planctomycetota bacterium]